MRFKNSHAALLVAACVAALNANADGPLTQSEADDLAARLAAGTEMRATVLRKIAENDRFKAAELNRALAKG